MNPKQIDLVKSTVPVLRENGVVLTNYFYNRMLANHPDLKETFNMGHQRSGAQAKALAGAVLAYAENIEDPSVLMPVVELIAHKHVSLNIQAPDYSIVGENLLHSISEVLNISMQDPLIEAWAIAYGQLADLFIRIEKEIYDQHQQEKGSWLGWRKFEIAKKVVESEEITSFYLKPSDGGDLPHYEVGQYISVRVFVEALKLKQPRQYTLSTNPQSEYLRISVKREAQKGELEQGWVSSTLHAMAEGDEVEVSAPTGNFYLVDAQKPNVFISAGVGLTPMIAMLNQLVKLEMPQPVTFIHACRSPNVHAMKQHVQDLKNQFPHLYTVTAYEYPNTQASSEQNEQIITGRLDLAMMDNTLFPSNADYYLCGPMPFMAEQHQALLARGIAAENIHTEAFGTGGVQL